MGTLRQTRSCPPSSYAPEVSLAFSFSACVSVSLIFFVNLFQDVVNIFASVSDPDYPGHVILEQFQAQVRVVTLNFPF